MNYCLDKRSLKYVKAPPGKRKRKTETNKKNDCGILQLFSFPGGIMSPIVKVSKTGPNELFLVLNPYTLDHLHPPLRPPSLSFISFVPSVFFSLKPAFVYDVFYAAYQ
ncbi:hypothetical protein CEXT_753251 [Caerostris extrusa]|uniref:Uncharacterized protein n=1 Tax=Caerostris extrusa TaxID=172846 RepID=A0AAV4U8Z0_CAEEX|nr:hypothetical protein CEXT_753251 [Caerostris extrusa]